jgi:hypothetical protein
MNDFAIMDCALAIVATGRRAQTLRELRDILRDIHSGSIYHHFWGTLLRPRSISREYNNDFAEWCHKSLHDNRVAERLAVIDPCEFSDMESLRQELLDVIDERLDETELMLFAQADQQFHFVRGVLVQFDTHKRLKHPRELVAALPNLSVGSVFYHFIDARRREPISIDDFRAWLQGDSPRYDLLIERLAEIDPYFDSLYVLRQRLSEVVSEFFSTPRSQRPHPRSEAQAT